MKDDEFYPQNEAYIKKHSKQIKKQEWKRETDLSGRNISHLQQLEHQKQFKAIASFSEQVHNEINEEEDHEESNTEFLHQKIEFLERELNQLSKAFSDEGRSNMIMEEIKLENQQLREGLIKQQQMNYKYQSQLQKSEKNNEQLRNQLLQLSQQIEELNQQITNYKQLALSNQKINFSSSNESKQEHTKIINSHQLTITKDTKKIQQQLMQSNQQIQMLLQKLHQHNQEYNEELLKNQHLTEQLNLQNNIIENIRKENMDLENKYKELYPQNMYLKEEISRVTEMSIQNQKAIQDIYIQKQIKDKLEIQTLQKQIYQLKQFKEVKMQKDLSQNYKNYQENIKNTTESYKKQIKKIQAEQITLQNQNQNLKEQLLEQTQKQTIIRKKYDQTIFKLEKQLNIYSDEAKKYKSHMRELQIGNQKLNSDLEEYKIQIHQKQYYKQAAFNHQECKNVIHRLQIEKEQIYRNRDQYLNAYEKLVEENKIIKKKEEEVRQKLSESISKQQYRIIDQNKRKIEVQLHKSFNEKQRLIEELKEKSKTIARIMQQNQENVKNVKEEAINGIIQRYNEKIKQKNTEIQDLNDKIDRISDFERQTNARISEQAEIVKRQMKQTSQKLSSFIQKNQILFNKNQNLQKELIFIKKKNSEHEGQNILISKLNSENSQLSQENSKLHSCVKQMENQSYHQSLLFEEIKGKDRTNQRQIEELNHQYQMEKTRFDKEDFYRNKFEYEQLVIKYKETNRQFEKLKEQLNEMQRNHRSRSKESKYINREKFSINNINNHQTVSNNASIKECEKQNNFLKIDNSSLRSQVQQLNFRLNQKQKVVIHYENILRQEKQKNEKMNDEVQHLQSQLKFEKNKLKMNPFENLSNKQQQEKIIELKCFLEEKQRLIRQLKMEIDELKRKKDSPKSQTGMATGISTISLNYENRSENNNLTNIKYHPEVKKLQSEIVSQQRTIMQQDQEIKKQANYYQDQINKMKIQNQCHRNKITQLYSLIAELKTNKGSISYNYDNSIEKQEIIKKYQLKLNQKHKEVARCFEKIEVLQDKVEILNSQFVVDNQQDKGIKGNKRLSNISPFNSQTHLRHLPSQTPQRELNHLKEQIVILTRRIEKANDDSMKLKQCLDQKLIENQITPRQPYCTIQRAIWLFQRLTTDGLQQKKDLQILRQQKRDLATKLETKQSLNGYYQSRNQKNKSFQPKIASLNPNYSQSFGLKNLKEVKSIPRLNFSPSETHDSQIVLQQTKGFQIERRNSYQNFKENFGNQY